jgi:hypothetical protein
MTMKRALWILLLTASCSSRPAPSGQSYTYENQCLALHKTCKLGGATCCSGFCSLTGYINGTCEAPLADGAYCQDASWCASGVCQNYQCGVQTCGATNAACKSDGDCCAGFCDNFTYKPWVCTAPLPDGASCERDNQCAAGVCQNYQCGACSSLGASCKVDTDCCGGSFCDNFTYAPPTCTAAWPSKHYCNEDRQCASGACTNYLCQ